MTPIRHALGVGKIPFTTRGTSAAGAVTSDERGGR